MGTIRFELRRDKLSAKKMAPISLIYQVAGNRVRIPTNEQIYPCNWDAKARRATYVKNDLCRFPIGKEEHKVPKTLIFDTEQIKDVNKALDKIQTRIEDLETVFEKTNVPYTAEMIKSRFLETAVKKHLKTEEKGLLYSIIDEYVEVSKNDLQAGSLKKYTTLSNHLKEFEKYSKVKIRLENLDDATVIRFRTYLNETKDLNNSTALKMVTTLKTIINYARNEKDIVIAKYKGKRQIKGKSREEELPVIVLTQAEFQSLIELDLSEKPSLDHVRNAFVFSCCTGLRFSDLKQLTWDHIQDDALDLSQIKTTQQVFIPFNNIAKGIVAKYVGKEKPLYVISNQKANDYLKDIGKEAKIDSLVEKIYFKGSVRHSKFFKKYELMTTHMARRCFISFSLEKGMGERDVMRFSGHRDFHSVSRYVSATREHQRSLMKKIWDDEKQTDNNTLKIVS